MKSKKKSPAPAGEDENGAAAAAAVAAPRPNSIRGLMRRTLGEDLRSITSSMKGVFSRRATMPADATRTSSSNASNSESASGHDDSMSKSAPPPTADGRMDTSASASTSASTAPTTTTSASAALLAVFRSTSGSTSEPPPEKVEASTLAAPASAQDGAEAGGRGALGDLSNSASGSGGHTGVVGVDKGEAPPPPRPPPPPPPLPQLHEQARQEDEHGHHQPASSTASDGEDLGGERLVGLVGAGGEHVVRRLEKSASFLAAAAGGAAASLSHLMHGSSPGARPRRRTEGEKRPGPGPANEHLATIMQLAVKEEEELAAAAGSRDGLTDPALLASYDGTETLSRNHPVFEMIRQRSQVVARGGKEDMCGSGHDGNEGLASALSSSSSTSSHAGGQVSVSSVFPSPRPAPTPASTTGTATSAIASTAATSEQHQPEGGGGDQAEEAYSPFVLRKKTDYHHGYVEKLVLKFTTYSQNNEESAFVIGKNGGSIGRDACNTVSVPSDTTLLKEGHALIGHKNGSFYLKNQGASYCAAIRIGTDPGLRDWPLDLGATFSAGNSIFLVKELTGGDLVTEVIDGPLKGERRKVSQKGATLGRSPDNTLSIADPELSRRHSRIEFDEKDGKVS